MSLFRHTVASAVESAGSGQALMVVVLLREEGGGSLLESDVARAELTPLPLACLRLRRGTQDYANFTSMCAGAAAESVLLVGAGGSVVATITDMSDDAVVAGCKKALQDQAAKVMLAMMGQQAGTGAAGVAPAAAATSSGAGAAAAVEVASEAQFQDIVRSAPRVVVDWYADWCGPCKRIAPVYAELARGHPEITFVKINADRFKPLAQREGVAAYPTFHFYAGGRRVNEVRGGSQQALEDAVHGFAAADAGPINIDWGDDGVNTPAAAPPAPVPEAPATPAARPVRNAAARESVQRKIQQVKDTKSGAKSALPAEKPVAVEEEETATAEETTMEREATNALAAPRVTEKKEAVKPVPANVCRLSIRLLNGSNVRRTFDPKQTLNDVREALVHDEPGRYLFVTTFPRRRYACTEEGATLEQCQLTPSGTLTLQAVDAPRAAPPVAASTTPTPWGAYLMSWLFGTPSNDPPPAAPAQRAPPTRPKPDSADKDRYNGNGTAFEYGG
eukprot:TRINITY_DN13851_c0_g1_i1.p1 TRINITY_DN13851_c0_g1~~TRINITY_DN13851_c0_g1_i1.p1  ORF type:complete len:518 (+),score=106.09 TRINITY_DN13851_c0_g1_i1:44-1555(+)